MESFWRLLWRSATVGLAAGPLAWPPAANSAATERPVEPKAISLWDTTVTLRGAAGYKDNLVLSHSGAEESGFWLSGLDLLVFRLPEEGKEFSFGFTGEDRRFFSGQRVRKEQIFYAHASGRREVTGGWRAALDLLYYYQDQVYDVSAEGVGFGTLLARGHTLSLRPGVGRSLGHGAWLEVEFPVARQYLAEPLDDYWEGGPRLVLRRAYGARSELSLSYQIADRLYDNREQTDADGVDVPGAGLQVQVQKGELAWRHHWDAQRHWRSTVKAVVELNHDNGAGYFNYKKYRAVEELRLRSGKWTLSAATGVSSYQYDLQTVSATDAARRSKFGVVAEGRIERAFSDKFRGFLEFEHEHFLANRDIDKYRVNTVFSGVELDF